MTTVRVNKFKFFLLVSFCLTKLSGIILYYKFYEQLGLDYGDVFASYCKRHYEFSSFSLLNTPHRLVFSAGCQMGENIYFWVFAVTQFILLFFALNTLFDRYSKAIFPLLIVLFTSPTISFFSSAPTKDGFLVLFTSLAVLFGMRISVIIFMISVVFRPYLILFFALLTKSMRLMVTLAILVIYLSSDLLDMFVNVLLLKLSFVQMSALTPTGTDVLWIVEIFVVMFFALRAKILQKLEFLILFGLCILAAGVSLNVSSRLFVSSVFYIISLKASRNDKS